MGSKPSIMNRKKKIGKNHCYFQSSFEEHGENSQMSTKTFDNYNRDFRNKGQTNGKNETMDRQKPKLKPKPPKKTQKALSSPSNVSKPKLDYSFL